MVGLILWLCPEAPRLVATSRTSTKAPSHAGLIRHQTGVWVAGFMQNLGTTENDLAECWGLRDGNLGILVRNAKVRCSNLRTQSETNCFPGETELVCTRRIALYMASLRTVASIDDVDDFVDSEGRST
ncbi:hypothetical protein M9H77_04562 [Catharanthus roseus]|uniref:Uncharacterized protein n=1 Tax=Catharanthus roseus TaxID=4058 RepID=A0ACC0CEL8_CATRO|nr:hypothetical protein M9H77_04562 [Catharanthus roseus]